MLLKHLVGQGFFLQYFSLSHSSIKHVLSCFLCVSGGGGDDMAMLGQMSTHTYYHEPIEQYIPKALDIYAMMKV